MGRDRAEAEEREWRGFAEKKLDAAYEAHCDWEQECRERWYAKHMPGVDPADPTEDRAAWFEKYMPDVDPDDWTQPEFAKGDPYPFSI